MLNNVYNLAAHLLPSLVNKYNYLIEDKLCFYSAKQYILQCCREAVLAFQDAYPSRIVLEFALHPLSNFFLVILGFFIPYHIMIFIENVSFNNDPKTKLKYTKWI